MKQELTTLELAKIINDNIERIIVFTPKKDPCNSKWVGTLDDISQVSINGNAVQVTIKEEN